MHDKSYKHANANLGMKSYQMLKDATSRKLNLVTLEEN